MENEFISKPVPEDEESEDQEFDDEPEPEEDMPEDVPAEKDVD